MKSKIKTPLKILRDAPRRKIKVPKLAPRTLKLQRQRMWALVDKSRTAENIDGSSLIFFSTKAMAEWAHYAYMDDDAVKKRYVLTPCTVTFRA